MVNCCRMQTDAVHAGKQGVWKMVGFKNFDALRFTIHKYCVGL